MTIYFSSDDLLHVLIVILSFTILGTSFLAYLRKPASRYFFLFLAFLFLASSQSVTFAETFFFGDQQLMIPYIDLHLAHLLDFAMLLSFSLALTIDIPFRRGKTNSVELPRSEQ